MTYEVVRSVIGDVFRVYFELNEPLNTQYTTLGIFTILVHPASIFTGEMSIGISD